MTIAASNKLVLIGVSGLDWAGFVARVRRGALPRLAAFAARGASSPLIVPPPGQGPSPWATIASGLLPEAHGVIRPDEAWAGGIRPAGKASWRVPAVWERLEASGIASASVCWPATSPGENWAGPHIDDSYAAITGRDWNDWALPPHCLPATHREALRSLRTHPSEMRAEALLPLVPTLPNLAPAERTRLPELAAAMARTASEQAAMIWLLGQEDWNAAFLHHGWLGAIRGHFENASPPYDQVEEGAWRFLDGLAGLLVERSGDATVLVISDGWRNQPGVMLAVGPQIQKGSVTTTDALDLAPAVLAHWGLKTSALPGRAPGWIGGREMLVEAAPCSMVPTEKETNLLEALIAEGYRAPPPISPQWRALGLGRLAEAMVERDASGARAIAREALTLDPGSLPAMRALGSAAIKLDDCDALGQIADALEEQVPALPWSKLARASWHIMRGSAPEAARLLLQAEAAEDIETRLRVGTAWLMLHRPGDARRIFRSALAIAPGLASAELGLSAAALAERNYLEAEAPLHSILEREPGHAAAYAALADIYRAQGRASDAETAHSAAKRLRFRS